MAYKIFRNLLFSLIVFPFQVLVAQNLQTVDSLTTVLHQSSNDSLKTEIYLELAFNYFFKQNQIAIGYADSAYQIMADKPDSELKLRTFLVYTENLSMNKKDSLSILFLDKCVQMNNRLPENKQIKGYLDFTSAITYQNSFDYPAALLHYQKAVDYFESTGKDIRIIAGIYNSLGALYNRMNDYEKALFYFNKSLKMSQENGFKIIESNALLNLGNTFYSQAYDDTSRYYFQKSLELCTEQNDVYGVTLAQINLGNITSVKGNAVEGKKLYLQALHNIEKYGFVDLEGSIISSLAYGYYQLENYDSSLYFAELSKHRALLNKDFETISYAYNLIAYSLYEQDLAKAAFDSLSLSLSYKDSIQYYSTAKQIATLETKHTYEKILEDERLKQDQEGQVYLENISELKSIASYLIIALVFTIIIVTLQIRSRKKETAHIQELNKKNAEIENQRKQLENLNQVKNKIFSIISHDLKGPLNSLSSLMQLMQIKGINQEEFHTLLFELQKKLNSNANLLNNLLQWAKSQMEGIHLNIDKIPLNTLVESNINLFEGAAQEKNICLVNSISEDFVVYADKEMIKLVLRNLLSNAIKFSDENSTIHLTAMLEQDNQIVISIIDQGKGIPSIQKDKIFSLGVSSTPGTKNERGTGIGLLLCKEFVARNGGAIWVESEEGKGSTFSFTLKAA